MYIHSLIQWPAYRQYRSARVTVPSQTEPDKFYSLNIACAFGMTRTLNCTSDIWSIAQKKNCNMLFNNDISTVSGVYYQIKLYNMISKNTRKKRLSKLGSV
jgi:hypothetical protein